MFNDASFRKYNNLVGWGVFIFSAIIYCLTIEPTASFWDCGEYIACSYGIETGHPPGAPLFLLIAFLIGLSIGVHLLNLLTIPALVFIYYFRKKTFSLLGFGITFVVAIALLGGVQDLIIPGIVKLAGKTELYFVNDLGWSFNS